MLTTCGEGSVDQFMTRERRLKTQEGHIPASPCLALSNRTLCTFLLVDREGVRALPGATLLLPPWLLVGMRGLFDSDGLQLASANKPC